MKDHHYLTTIKWKGNQGTGTSEYSAYSRDHILQIQRKPRVPCSSGVCSVRRVVVVDYLDNAEGTMKELADGRGRFRSVVLRPHINIAAGNVTLAKDLRCARTRYTSSRTL